MTEYIAQRDVPHNMAGRCPWGQPYDRWTTDMLRRGLAEASQDDCFPNTRNSILTELNKRRGT